VIAASPERGAASPSPFPASPDSAKEVYSAATKLVATLQAKNNQLRKDNAELEKKLEAAQGGGGEGEKTEAASAGDGEDAASGGDSKEELEKMTSEKNRAVKAYRACKKENAELKEQIVAKEAELERVKGKLKDINLSP